MRIVLSLLCAALLTSSVFAQEAARRFQSPDVVIDTINVVPIATARKDSSNLRAWYLNDTLKLAGVITTTNLQTGKTAYCIQDTSAGIYLFYNSATRHLSIGDSVSVIGQIQQYHGLTEIVPGDTNHIVLIKSNAAVPKPIHLTFGQFNTMAEQYESMLVEVDTLYRSFGYWPAATKGASIYLSDSLKYFGTDSIQQNVLLPSQRYPSSDSIQMYLTSATNIPGSADSLIGYPINLIGVVSQYTSSTTVYNNGYELEPRYSADIQSTHLVPLLTIAQARVESNWVPVYSTNGDTISITGVVTSVNLGAASSYSSYFIQDSTAGVDVYCPTLLNYKIGDSVFVIGTVDQYNGLEEVEPLPVGVGDSLHFGLLKHGAALPQPKHLTVSGFTNAHNAEMYEGQVIELDSLYKTSGTWPASGSSASIYVSSLGGTSTVQLYINKNTDVPGTPEHLYPVNVVGVVSQYGTDSTGYEVIPMDTTDIWRTPGLTPLYTIAQARVDADSNGIPDHKVTGDTLMIIGVITSPNLSASTSANYFVQDATAGIDIFRSGASLSCSPGDSVWVVGKITQFDGLTEITPLDSAHFALLKHNAALPKAKHITLHQFVLAPESYEGLLVEVDSLNKIHGTWAAGGTDTLTSVTPSTDTAFVYLNSYTDVGHSIEPTYPINVVGVASQHSSGSTVYTGGYEIIPRDSTDLTTTLPGTTTLYTLAGATNRRADTLVLKWHPASFASKYLFQLSASRGFSSYFVNDSNVTDTTRKVTALANSTKYYWHVAARNAGGFSAFSPIDSFTTIIAPPAAPVLASPVGTTGEPRRTTLKWNPSAAATKYHLQVASDSSPDSIGGFKAANVVFDTTLADTVKKLSTPLTATTKYYWHVSATDTGGTSAYSTTANFTTGTGIDAVNGSDGIPKEFALFQNYPNPFNPSTMIRYDLPKNAYVKVTIYDILGRVVVNLVDGTQTASRYTVEWNPSGLSSGVYFCRISAKSQDGSDNFTSVKKLLYMK